MAGYPDKQFIGVSADRGTFSRRLALGSLQSDCELDTDLREYKEFEEFKNRSQESGGAGQGMGADWRGAALTRASRLTAFALWYVGPRRVRTGASRERPSVWLLYRPIGQRHWVKVWRWVILGSRLLSRFPVATRDRAKYRQV
jgi:hypothetical protein